MLQIDCTIAVDTDILLRPLRHSVPVFRPGRKHSIAPRFGYKQFTELFA